MGRRERGRGRGRGRGGRGRGGKGALQNEAEMIGRNEIHVNEYRWLPWPRRSLSAPSSEKATQLCLMSSTNAGQGLGGGISLGEGCGCMGRGKGRRGREESQASY